MSLKKNFKNISLIIILSSIIIYFIFYFIRNKNNKNLLVSILIPAYNVEQYIKECLDSLINQTYKNIEIIIIDDYSNDNTVKIIQDYLQKDNRIQLYKNNSNLGVSATRNIALKKSKGDYVYFIDPDDFIDKNFINSGVKIVKKYNSDVVIFNNIITVYEEENRQTKFYNNLKFNKIKYNYPINIEEIGYFVWNKLVQRDLLIKNDIRFPENIRFAEDQIYSFKTLIHAKNPIIFNNKDYYFYRKRPNSAISGKFKKYKNRIRSLISVHYELYNYIKQTNNESNIIISIDNLLDFAFTIMLSYYDLENMDQQLYSEIRFLFIEILDVILINKDLYDKNVLNYYINIIKYKNLDDFIKWKRKYIPISNIKLKWYDKYISNL